MPNIIMIVLPEIEKVITEMIVINSKIKGTKFPNISSEFTGEKKLR